MSADLPGQFLGPLVPKLATKLSLEQLSYIKISKVICLLTTSCPKNTN